MVAGTTEHDPHRTTSAPRRPLTHAGVLVRRWSVSSLLVVALLITVVMTATERPEELPPVALGSLWVLAALRFAVVFAILFGAFVLLERAWRGQLPSKIGTSETSFEEVLEGDAVLEAQEVFNARLERVERAVFPEETAMIEGDVRAGGVSAQSGSGKEVS